MLDPKVCKAARELLGWNQVYLARRAGLGESTLRAFEARRNKLIRENVVAIRLALKNGGVEFGGEVEGYEKYEWVRLRPPNPH